MITEALEHTNKVISKYFKIVLPVSLILITCIITGYTLYNTPKVEVKGISVSKSQNKKLTSTASPVPAAKNSYTNPIIPTITNSTKTTTNTTPTAQLPSFTNNNAPSNKASVVQAPVSVNVSAIENVPTLTPTPTIVLGKTTNTVIVSNLTTPAPNGEATIVSNSVDKNTPPQVSISGVNPVGTTITGNGAYSSSQSKLTN
ncbi:MAG: hypothetical protein ACREHC_03895 [Candidatus Levyibacteriota bacterium]